MATLTKSSMCVCCKRQRIMGLDDTMCGWCSRRGGLCMHNVFERVAAGGEAIMHSSRPHRDDTGANDPRTCQWCLAKLLERGE